MVKKQVYIPLVCTLAFTLLVSALVFTACSNTVDYGNVERGTFYYLKVLPEPENGTILLSHDRASAGTQVRVYILPDPGFVLNHQELQFRTFDTIRTSSEPIPKLSRFFYASWSMRPVDTTVTARFIPKRGTDTYTVSVKRDILPAYKA